MTRHRAPEGGMVEQVAAFLAEPGVPVQRAPVEPRTDDAPAAADVDDTEDVPAAPSRLQVRAAALMCGATVTALVIAETGLRRHKHHRTEGAA